MTANFTGGSGGSGGYNYVQDATPSGAVEGEEWYDTGANAAYVYDGASWIEQTVTDHAQLSGVGASDHHAKPTSTQSTSSDAGYVNYYSGASFSNGNTRTSQVNDVLDGIHINETSGNGTSYTVTVYFANRANETYNGQTESTFNFSEGLVDKVDVTDDTGDAVGGTYTADFSHVGLPTHSHNI